MNVLRYRGKRSSTNMAVIFITALGLAACATAEKPNYPGKPTEPQPLREVTFTIDAKGDFTAKDAHGKPIGTRCSTDPKAPDVCPIFDPGHKVQVEDVSNVSLIKYSGSPQCYLVIVNGVAYVLPSASYCKR